jgi:uncharacterized protein (DUF1330 family)
MTDTPGFVNWSLHRKVSGVVSSLTEKAMAEAYWIAWGDVNDPEPYKAYVSGAAEVFAERGARGGRDARARNGVIGFPSPDAALDCYTSVARRLSRAHRVPAAMPKIVIVEGAEPQDQKR